MSVLRARLAIEDGRVRRGASTDVPDRELLGVVAPSLDNRPAGSNNLFVAWETLTHGDNPN
ncbi:hypothetical protein [Streptomyces sp. NPDC002520]